MKYNVLTITPFDRQLKQLSKIMSILLIILCLFALPINAAPDIVPSITVHNFDYSSVKQIIVPFTEEHKSKPRSEGYGALWAGFYLEMDADPLYTGQIINWEDGETSWIIKINSPGAPALAVFINQLDLSKDSRITVFPENNPENRYTIFENEINTDIISFPVMKGETLIVEYTEKTVENDAIKGFFVICDLMVIFTGFDMLYDSKGLGTAQSCNVNVNCSPEGDNWKNNKRSVVKMIMRKGTYSYLCSGSLVNNTKNDCMPYILTAYHCAGDASSDEKNRWQFYFNYERPGCENSGTPPNNLITGCTLKAKGDLKGGSDFQLLLLNEQPNPLWKPYFSGWDWSDYVSPLSGVCIHHPDGDAKKISTYTTIPNSVTPNIEGEAMATHSAWLIYWAKTENGFGITEGGSSGSPLFNSKGLIVGTLTGGTTECDYAHITYDVFGKFSYHWNSNGNKSKDQLQPWLDPNDSEAKSNLGYDPESEYYEITFSVKNNWGEPVANAKVEIESIGNIGKTDRKGLISIFLPKMKINYTVSQIGYEDNTGNCSLSNENIKQKIVLQEDIRYISLFMPPFSKDLKIANAKNIEQIRIYNLIGQSVYNQEFDGGAMPIFDVSFLQSGLYIFVTKDNRGVDKSFKIMIF